MTPRSVSQRIVVDRLALVDKLLSKIQQLPLTNLTDFLADELYEICTTHLADIAMSRNAYQRWLDQNPDKVSTVL
jgi:hypothetical protein